MGETSAPAPSRRDRVVRYTVRLTPTERATLDRVAAARGVTACDVVRYAIYDAGRELGAAAPSARPEGAA